MTIKKAFLLLLITWPCLPNIAATANDTLLFRSGFEERLFQNALNNKEIDLTALYAVINSDSAAYQTFAARLNRFYASMDPKVSTARSPRQKAKLIFKEVHSYFFTQYEENVFFNKIFEDGVYNCVTASMIYSLVLERYNIPFEIKEKPTHVYLVSYPGMENILFETTNPAGFYLPDEKSKREYVAGLVSMKLISQEYVNSVGLAKAFNEFYYDNDNITPKELAGLQYFNESLKFYRDGNIHSAIRSAVKATMLHPGTKHQYMKTSLIREALANSNFESLRDILYLSDYANSSTDLRDKKFVVATFEDILNTALIKQGNDKFVTDAYHLMAARVEDKSIMDDISYNYNLGMGYWESMKGNMDQSLVYCGQAFLINEKDARLQELIVRAITLKTDKLKGKQTSIDALDAFAEKFPFLRSHKTFRSYLVYQYAFRSYSLFLENSREDGYKYLEQMEKELKDMDEKMIMGSEFIGMVYAEAGAFHFRHKEFKKAREIISRGLELLPDHGELKERLKIIDYEEENQKGGYATPQRERSQSRTVPDSKFKIQD